MKNKIISTLCIFLFISLIFVNNSFAVSLGSINGSSYKFFIPDVPYNKFLTLEEYKSGNYDFFMELNNGTCHVYFFEKNSGIEIRVTKNKTYYSNFESIDNFKCIYYEINESSGAISGPSTRTDFAGANWSYGYWASGSNLYFYTNLEPYSVDGSSDFFFVAPVIQPEIPEKIPETLAGIMSKAGEQATAEVVQIILIVITTTAGLMVLLIGLKKGLTVLMNGFRH